MSLSSSCGLLAMQVMVWFFIHACLVLQGKRRLLCGQTSSGSANLAEAARRPPTCCLGADAFRHLGNRWARLQQYIVRALGCSDWTICNQAWFKASSATLDTLEADHLNLEDKVNHAILGCPTTWQQTAATVDRFSARRNCGSPEFPMPGPGQTWGQDSLTTAFSKGSRLLQVWNDYRGLQTSGRPVDGCRPVDGSYKTVPMTAMHQLMKVKLAC